MQPNQPYSPAPQAPAPPPAPGPDPSNTPHPPEYGFIMNPDKPPRRNVPSFGGSSLAVKIGLIGGGLLLLLILFIVIRGILNGGGNSDAFITVAQEQQELIHLSTDADQLEQTQQGTLSTTNKNFVATAKISLASNQAELLKYLKSNGTKVSEKALAAKVSTTTDQQLKTAAASSTYNDTFKQVMEAQLKDYETALQQAYKQAKGPKGRALFSQQFDSAQLLEKQLNAPES